MILKQTKHIKCRCCGRVFDSNQSAVRYCSDACRREAIRKYQSAYKRAMKAETQKQIEESIIESRIIDTVLSSQEAHREHRQCEAENHSIIADNTCEAYWRAYKESVLSYDFDKSRYALVSFVNDIDIHLPDFAELVVKSIAEQKKIIAITHFETTDS